MPMRSKRYDSPLAPQKLAASADQFANPVPIPSASLAMFLLRSVLFLYSLFVPAQDRQRKISERDSKSGPFRGNATAAREESLRMPRLSSLADREARDQQICVNDRRDAGPGQPLSGFRDDKPGWFAEVS